MGKFEKRILETILKKVLTLNPAESFLVIAAGFWVTITLSVPRC